MYTITYTCTHYADSVWLWTLVEELPVMPAWGGRGWKWRGIVCVTSTSDSHVRCIGHNRGLSTGLKWQSWLCWTGGHQFWCIGHNRVYVTSTGLSSDSDGWRWSPVLMYWTQSCLCDQYGSLKWQWWLKVVTSSDVLDTIVFMWPVRVSQVTVMVEGGHQFSCLCIGHNRVYVTSTGLSSDSDGWRWSPVLMYWTQSCLCDQYGPLKRQWWLKVVTSLMFMDTIVFMWVTVMVEGGHQFWCIGHNRVYVTSTGLSSDSHGWRWSPVLMCWTQSCLCDQYGSLKWQSWLMVEGGHQFWCVGHNWTQSCLCEVTVMVEGGHQFWCIVTVFMWPVRASQVTVMVEGGHQFWCIGQNRVYVTSTGLSSDSDGWRWSPVWCVVHNRVYVTSTGVTVMVEGGHQFWCIGHNRVYVTSTGLSSDSHGWRWSPVLMYWTQSCLCDQYGPLKWQWWLKVVTSSDVLDTIVFMWPVRASQVTVMVEGGHQFWCIGHNRVYVTSTGLSSDSDGWRWSPVLMYWTQSCLCDQYGSLKWQWWLKVVTSSDALDTIVFMWPVRASQVTVMVEGGHQFWCVGHNRVYVTSTGLSSDSDGWRWSPVLMYWTQSC